MPRGTAGPAAMMEAVGETLPLSRRNQAAVLGALAAVSVLAWIYLLYDAARIRGMAMGDPGMVMAMKPWTMIDLVFLFVMWAVMMVAMMLPSAAAAILTYGAIVRRISPQQPAARSIAMFVLGYLLTWTAFSLAATVLQWGLDHLALLSPMMVVSSPFLGGALLIAAGLYQFSEVKDVCLKHCQTPLIYLAQNWRQGAIGALRLGLSHGLYCVGCCWAVMGLLFVGGVMNLLWIAAIAIFVLLEKLAPFGGRIGRAFSGTVAIAAGLAMIVTAG